MSGPVQPPDGRDEQDEQNANYVVQDPERRTASTDFGARRIGQGSSKGIGRGHYSKIVGVRRVCDNRTGPLFASNSRKLLSQIDCMALTQF